MRPAEFTPEAIIQAGQELQLTGRNITGFALRQKVGGGNPTRLKQVWDEHINSQTTASAEPVAELPIEIAEELALVTRTLTNHLAALAVELNDKAVKAAERRADEVVRTAGEQREQADRELADAAQTVDDLENKLNEVTHTAVTLEKRLADSQASNQAQAVELAQVRERLAQIEQTAKAITEHHASELIGVNATLESERQHYQQETAQLRTELARMQTREETARETAARLSGQVEALQRQAADQLHALASHQAAVTEEKAKTPRTKKQETAQP